MEQKTSELIAAKCNNWIGYWDFRGVGQGGGPKQPKTKVFEMVLMPATISSFDLRLFIGDVVEAVKPGDHELLHGPDGGMATGTAWPRLIAERVEREFLVKGADSPILPKLSRTAPICNDLRALKGVDGFGILPLQVDHPKFRRLNELASANFEIRATLAGGNVIVYSEGTGFPEGFPPDKVKFQGILVKHTEWQKPTKARTTIPANESPQLAVLQNVQVFLQYGGDSSRRKKGGPTPAPKE